MKRGSDESIKICYSKSYFCSLIKTTWNSLFLCQNKIKYTGAQALELEVKKILFLEITEESFDITLRVCRIELWLHTMIDKIKMSTNGLLNIVGGMGQEVDVL